MRFASVYRHFEDVEAFHEEIRKLRDQRELKQSAPERKRPARRQPAQDRDQLSLLPAEPPSAEEPGTGEEHK